MTGQKYILSSKNKFIVKNHSAILETKTQIFLRDHPQTNLLYRGWLKRLLPGLVNFAPAVAYQLPLLPQPFFPPLYI